MLEVCDPLFGVGGTVYDVFHPSLLPSVEAPACSHFGCDHGGNGYVAG